MSTSDYLSAKANAKTTRFTKFLWWCAGADSYFLQKSPKQDRVKYAGIGGIVFATGMLAIWSKNNGRTRRGDAQFTFLNW